MSGLSRDQCWLAPAQYTHHGRDYGRIVIGGRHFLLHRLSWIFANGPIPAGMFVCHRCDNPPCINPEHLFLGTHADNLRDASRKGRMHPGERHGMHRLTERDVLETRRLLAEGVRGTVIAAKFGISKNTVYHVKKGRTWASL